MADPVSIVVSLSQQTLTLWADQQRVAEYSISSSLLGAGEMLNSFKTPRGQHAIYQKIGAGLPMNAVLVGRKPTGEYYSERLAKQFPQRDWILTRALWLTGLEAGKNCGGSVDTLSRTIYIHGCPESCPLGVPQSHGCIRLRNSDIVPLFDRVRVGTLVLIN